MRPPYPCTSAAHYSLENRTSRSDMSFADYHPCNRRFSSSADEAPTHIPSSVRLWLPVPPGLPPLFCNARWHHRRTAQTTFADSASPSIDQRHSVETGWLTPELCTPPKSAVGRLRARHHLGPL